VQAKMKHPEATTYYSLTEITKNIWWQFKRAENSAQNKNIHICWGIC